MTLPTPPPRFLTPLEVAAFLRVSRATVYRWIDLGLLKANKPCGRDKGILRIAREDLQAFSAQRWED